MIICTSGMKSLQKRFQKLSLLIQCTPRVAEKVVR